jgi:hypothetical protein
MLWVSLAKKKLFNIVQEKSCCQEKTEFNAEDILELTWTLQLFTINTN